MVKSPQLKELLAAHDKQGAMAFEDAPGTWIKGGTPGAWPGAFQPSLATPLPAS
jgi:hypothetical protein